MNNVAPDTVLERWASAPSANLVAHPRGQGDGPTVVEFGFELSNEAKKDVTFAAPVVSKVAG